MRQFWDLTESPYCWGTLSETICKANWDLWRREWEIGDIDYGNSIVFILVRNGVRYQKFRTWKLISMPLSSSAQQPIDRLGGQLRRPCWMFQEVRKEPCTSGIVSIEIMNFISNIFAFSFAWDSEEPKKTLILDFPLLINRISILPPSRDRHNLTVAWASQLPSRTGGVDCCNHEQRSQTDNRERKSKSH